MQPLNEQLIEDWNLKANDSQSIWRHFQTSFLEISAINGEMEFESKMREF